MLIVFQDDPTKSTSYKDIMPNGFFIQYGDGSGALGDYITDDFTIGGATIKALEMGLAHNSTLISGLMGIGYDVNEASNDPDGNTAPFTYPSIVDQMVSQGLITTKAYSLYLDDLEASTGSIIFGGIDSDKYSGDLLQLPVIPEEAENGTAIYAALAVAMDSLSITGQAGNITTITDKTELPVVLDSGTTLTYVPAQLANSVYELLNAVDDTENSGYVYVDCNLASTSPKMTLNFGFGGSSNVSVSVPISEMIISLPSVGGGGFGGFGGPELPFSSACALGINSQEEEPYILGDTFLRSAYVVYDLSNNVIAIAQTNFNSTTSSIVEFQAGATAIPNISGVASGVSVTASATAGKPPGGGKTTDGVTVASPTGTNTGASTTASTTATTTTAKSAAVGAVPAFPGSAMLVLGLSGVCMIAGGGWLLF
jgi:hypothetical protein